MANTWGESGTTWSQGDWGQQHVTTIYPSGLLTTSSLGTPDAYPEQGWGRFAWGQKDWGDNSLSVTLTGLSITGHLGTMAAAAEQGWGRDTWGAEPWGDSYSPVVSVSGYSITASLGTLAYAQSEEGWGRDEWGIGNWGQNTTTVIVDGLEMTGRFGPDGWGQLNWGEDVCWGGGLALTTTQLSIEVLTGLEMTGSVGTPTFAFDMIFGITGLSQIGAGLGVPNINDGADHTQGVGSLLATGSVGSLGHEMAYDISGLEATGYLSAAGVEVNDAQIIVVSTSLLATGSVGSATVDDMAVGLSTLLATGSVGAITPADVVGVTGYSITASVNHADLSPLG